MDYRFLLFPLLLLLACQSYRPATSTIYLIGDSTAANKRDDARPETGWGEMLAAEFDQDIRVDNHARNGRSSRSFRGEGLWDTVRNSLQPGDFVLMQFGHNDPKEGATRYSSPEQYADNLREYVRETRDAGARPVILTPIVRRKFGADGKLTYTHGDYPDAARRVAAELDVPLIDMTERSREVVNTLGDEASKSLYLWLSPGENANYPDGVEDDTHFSPEGARVMAGLVADGLRELRLAPARYLSKN
ncbi:rhamnogalacturonan acetylesterase [Lewinella sp. IMCC34183]|uniref:rhamnogalacturonan acetylesterase n=1 Tax=Lewinella sp. IMCC34183 TaxID=2248762 RepID=UPI000E2811DD|nr:rhamnogalacturonan acetylesterase [Lewinella sp. IMCC34183]